MSWDMSETEKTRFRAARILVNFANRLMQGELDCWEYPEITRGIEPKESRDGLVHYGYDGTVTLKIVVKELESDD